MAIYGDLRAPEEAARVAEDYARWLETKVSRFGMASEATASLLASIDISLGDVFDRCGDHSKALETFETGFNRLKKLPPSSSTDLQRAQRK